MSGGGFALRGRAVVLGLGLTGYSAARWLAARGVDVCVADTRDAPPFEARMRAELPEVPLFKGPFHRPLLESAALLVASPGLPLSDPAIAAAMATGVEVVGDIELFARALPAGPRVIAITGSNGKSTVTALTGRLVEAAGARVVVAGNIGTPVLDVLGEAQADGSWPDWYVLELSSYQLETTGSLAPAAATVLNISENHLDRYSGLTAYAAAKARIFERASHQVLNRDDERSMAMQRPGREVTTFGGGEPAGNGDWGLVVSGGKEMLATHMRSGIEPLMPVSALPLVGRHNAINALAALALIDAVGLDWRRAGAAITGFTGLPHRMTLVAELSGIVFINDSKATTVAAATAALEGVGRPCVLILGGDGKGQDFTALRSSVDRHCRAVLLLGRDAGLIEKALAGSTVPRLRVASLEEAVRAGRRFAQAGDAVLLSPACASLDMFRDFGHRGEVFTSVVRAIVQERAHA